MSLVKRQTQPGSRGDPLAGGEAVQAPSRASEQEKSPKTSHSSSSAQASFHG